jgi:hypothetical protein
MEWAPNSIYVLEWEQELRKMFLEEKKEKKVTRIEVNQRFNWRLTTSKF